MSRSRDERFMRRCFELARQGIGRVDPNPLVGCLIARGDEILAEGWHESYGEAHAEANAFRVAAEKNVNLTGTTLYCNLEPCCHRNKKTPPCLPLVLQSPIRRVVLSNSDPNPEVAGKSIGQMREAGIEVVVNVLEDEGRRLNRFFFHWMEKQSPWITLKIALTLDGKISEMPDRPTVITGAAAREQVQRLRLEHMAVLVGRGTVNADDPQLTVRAFPGRSPLRIVLDSELSSNPRSRIFSGDLPGETWVMHGAAADKSRVRELEPNGVRCLETASDKSGRVDLAAAMSLLAQNKINSVLVEGGAKVFGSFLSGDYFNSLDVFMAPRLMGKGLSTWPPAERKMLHLQEQRLCGEDIWLRYYPKKA